MTLGTTFLRMQQYSAGTGYPLATLRTAHPFFCPSTLSHEASNTPPAAFYLPIYLSTLHLPSSQPWILSPAYTTALAALKAVVESKLSCPRWPACGLPSGRSLHKFFLSLLLCSIFFNIITNLLFHNSSMTDTQ